MSDREQDERTPLHQSVVHGDAAVVRSLIGAGADMSTRDVVSVSEGQIQRETIHCYASLFS